MSRYILEYVFWLFCKYIKDNDKILDNDTISEFAKNNIIIDEEFEYTNVDNKFSYVSGVMKDKKLVLKNQKIL